MGGGSFSTKSYNDATTARAVTGAPAFAYSADISAGKIAAKVHETLDPKRLAGPTSPLAGKPIRESRDSGEHPESIAIAVFFDVTGSMGSIPMTLQQKLPKLMDVVLEKGGIKDPQILVGAIGDSYSDRVPFQVGQFESDNRFDEQLRNIYIEGGGGGQAKESYGLAIKWAADHAALDSFEKRGKKGYLFMMGDENFWPIITKDEVKKIFGTTVKEDESVENLLKRASEQWEIFFLRALDGSYPDGPGSTGEMINKSWKKLLGERVVQVENSSLVCEVIAGVVHMMEGAHAIDKVVSDIGLSGKDAKSVVNALAPLSKSLPVHVAAGKLPKSSKSNPTMTKI